MREWVRRLCCDRNRERPTRLRKATARQAPNAQRSTEKAIRELFERNVVPSYARFDLVLERARGFMFGMSMAGATSILAAGSPSVR